MVEAASSDTHTPAARAARSSRLHALGRAAERRLAPVRRAAQRAAAWIAPSRSARRLAGRLRDAFPITVRGLGIVGSAAVCLRWYGFRDLDGVWYVAGLGLLAMAALSALCMVIGFARVWWVLRRVAERPPSLSTDTELAVASGFVLPSLRFVPLVEVRASVLPPDSAELTLTARGAALTEQLAFHDHAEVRSIERRIEVRDVLGLTALAFRRRDPVEIDVLPHLGAFRQLPLLFSLSGGDDLPHPLGVDQGDRLELKRYAPGDPARFIHWKVYARTGKLVVRMPERALSRAFRVAAFLCAGADDAASAAAARAALMLGAFGADFRFGADGSHALARDVAEGLPMIRRSSAARSAPGAQLVPFMAQVEREGPASLVLFVPPGSPESVARLRELLRVRSRPVRVVIGVDGIVARGTRPLMRRVLFASRNARAVSAEALADTLTAYRKLGCDVVVLDRISGRTLSDAHFAERARSEERAA